MQAQAPTFEVASIKLNPVSGARVFRSPPEPGKPLFGIQGNRVLDEFSTVRELIMDAYHVKDFQIIGLPDWCIRGGDVYDIEARTESASPTVDQVRLMFQALLAERFELKLHRESRDLPVYELVIAKGGSKLKETAPADKLPTPPRGPLRAADLNSGVTTLPVIIARLLMLVDRPIIDKTGLTATYRYENFDWVGMRKAKLAGDNADPTESVYTAVQERLGLKLEPAKSPTNVLVVEHIARPSAN